MLGKRAERSDRRHVRGGNQNVLLFDADAELRRPLEILLPREPARRRIVNADVQQVDAGIILRIEPADVGARPPRFENDRHTVQCMVTGMKDMPGHFHCPTAAPQ
jgi:hypothetical protein